MKLVSRWSLAGVLLCAAVAHAEEPAKPKPAEVKVHDTVVFKLLRERKQQTAEQRARAASKALEQALEQPEAPMRVAVQDEGRAIFAGVVPIVQVYPEDAHAAGEESLDVYAGRIAARIRDGLAAERRRSDIAQTVFSISLVVFFGLIALYVLRRIGELSERLREFAISHPERIKSVRVSSVEVIGAGPLRAALLAALIVGRWVLWIGVVYVWLLLSLSRFEATRGYTSRLTSSLFTPISELASRTWSALPVLVLALLFAIGVYVLLRFVELFFVGVQRGEARAAWLPRDLIEPASVLVRVAIVLLAVVFAGPVVSGEPDSVLSRAGVVVLMSLALATTPLLASIALGTLTIFTRRLRVGRNVELGGKTGQVTSVGLLDVRLRDADGAEVRVPHFAALLKPSRVQVDTARLHVELCVSSTAPLLEVKELLEKTALGFGHSVSVELREIDADGARYLVSVIPLGATHNVSDLRLGLSLAIAREGIAWGRSRAGDLTP
ncbi:MAG TPA: mechanosensitive ion channel domain-containing protein [Polyangiales bacterium]|nr:mechanosensitive ion channel domain-containing protein [Polyangiales bacterium]